MNDEELKSWKDGFFKHGFTLHPGLTPEQNVGEIAKEIRDLRAEVEAVKDGKAYWLRQAENQVSRVKEAHEALESANLQNDELLKWAREQARSHQSICAEAYDAKNQENGDIHNSLACAYVSLVREIEERQAKKPKRDPEPYHLLCGCYLKHHEDPGGVGIEEVRCAGHAEIEARAINELQKSKAKECNHPPLEMCRNCDII